MYDLTNVLISEFLIFILVLIRMASLFVISPVFSRQGMPAQVKIGLALFCTFIVAPSLGNINFLSFNVFYFATLAIKELATGIILGFTSYLVFLSLLIAGQIIDVQIGFGMVNVLDPASNIQVPLMGNFLYLLAASVLLITNGHHVFLSALMKSYILVPIDGFALNDILINNMLNIFAECFVIGFKISVPVIAAVLLSEVALGVLARTVPQMNVFILGLPLKIIVGLASLIFIMPVFANTLDFIFNKLYAFIGLILQSLTKG